MSGFASSRSHISGSRAGSATSSSISRPTRTSRTPSNPSAGSAASTAAPWGSRIPAFGRTRTRAFTLAMVVPGAAGARSGRGAGARQPGGEWLADDPLVGVAVARLRALDDLRWNRRRRWRAIPAARRRPVAHELLVEARLRAARLVALGVPEARGVGGQHLVAEDQRAVGRETELELRVGQDDAAGASVLGGALVHRNRGVAHPLGQAAVADRRTRALEIDVLVVVAQRGLRRRGEQRLGQPLGFAQPTRQRDPADRAAALIVAPARAREVAADNAFDREYL